MTITAEQARGMVVRSVRRIVPDADFENVSVDADLQRTYELDSLDFLGFVELLSKESGVRIDEDDYPELATMATCIRFLGRRST